MSDFEERLDGSPSPDDRLVGSEPILLVEKADPTSSITRATIKALKGGGHVLCWCASFNRKSVIRARVLDAKFLPVREDLIIRVERPWVNADVVALSEGGFALTWSGRASIFLCFVDLSGAASSPVALAKFTVQIPELTLEQFPSGEVAVSWQEGLVILRADRVPLLSAVSPDAWHNAIALLSNDRLLRVETGKEQPYPVADPIYTINGAVFSASGHRMGDFRYRVPTKIVTDTYAHPQHLRVCALGERFLLIWTDLAFHKGNSIQAVWFDATGRPCCEPVTLVQGRAEAHVESASCIPLRSGGLLLAWSRDEGAGYVLTAQPFSAALTPTSRAANVSQRAVDDGGLISFSAAGRVVALWHEQGDIFLKSLELGLR